MNGDLSRARAEWLETNGLGGYASSTVSGMNTRRYHGLLVAATRPPGGRTVLLAKLEETLVLGGTRFELATNQFPGMLHPRGYRYLKGFHLDPLPTWVYEVEDTRLTKTLLMPDKADTVVVEWRLSGGASGASLEVRPLLAFRDFHALTHQNPALNGTLVEQPGLIGLTPYEELPTLFFAHDAETLDKTAWWSRHFEYEEERQRGFDFTEDLYSPFAFTFLFGVRAAATLIASTTRHAASDAGKLRRAELARRKNVAGASSADPVVRALTLAADRYLVRRGALTTVIAGYHWFGDWGRDTMISLPGLTLATGRTETAKEILLTFARHVDRGMLPNRFPEAGGAPEYNTVDATLWYFEAVRRLLAATREDGFVKEHLYPVLVDILDWHVKGTRYGIRVDGDGLLASGADGLPLTWMDAKVGDRVVTPRRGKPVEIQALFYNALRVMEDLAKRFGDRSGTARFGAMASQAAASFARRFWNEEAGCLYDVVDGETSDPSIRPNQVFALSLPHSMLSRERAARVLEVVERELLTPYGLRSLSPKDPAYRGRYEGDATSRDGAYHQGTVWPWLIGPFVTAYLRLNGGERARRRARRWIAPLSEHLLGEGLGQLPETYDGDAPQRPRGCIAQAWSVAELLRVLVEEVS